MNYGHNRCYFKKQSHVCIVEEAVKGDDKEAIDASAKKLSEASSSLAQKLYAEQAAADGDDTGNDPGGAATDNDAVDA